jgi:hypothetical protein
VQKLEEAVVQEAVGALHLPSQQMMEEAVVVVEEEVGLCQQGQVEEGERLVVQGPSQHLPS